MVSATTVASVCAPREVQTTGVWLYESSPATAVTFRSRPASETVSPAAAPRSLAAPFDSTAPCGPGATGARPESGRTANSETAAVCPPASALPVPMATGCALFTPGRAAHVCQALSGGWEPVKEADCPEGGAAKARWSADSPVTAEVLSLASPAVSPDSSPTSRVMSTMTVPIRANRPRANLRSLHATNMGSTLLAVGARGHRATVGSSRIERRSRASNFRLSAFLDDPPTLAGPWMPAPSPLPR